MATDEYPADGGPGRVIDPRLDLTGVDPVILARALALSPDAVALIEAEVRQGETHHTVAWLNPTTVALFGTPAAGAIGLTLSALTGESATEELDHLLATGAEGAADVVLRRTDGSTFPAFVWFTPLGTADGRRWWAMGIRERRAEHRVLERLEASERSFRAVAEQAPIGIFRSELGLRLGYANTRCAEILGLDVEQVLGRGWMSALPDEERERVIGALEQVLAGSEIELHQVRLVRPDGATRWVDLRVAPVETVDRAAGFVGSVDDVTERRLLEQTLAHDATHDRLTGLPNRTLLWHRLQSAVQSIRPELIVLFLDLDDFKLVNDSLGHEAGDQLLLAVADRLRGAVRPGDLVTRFGGDEFVVVCEGVSGRGQAEAIADRLARALAEPIRVAGREVAVTVSIGLVSGEQSGLDPESLLRDADVALYQAKGAGKNRWALFDERVREDASQRLAMAQDLRRALDAGQLALVYQPIVELRTGRVTAVESLSRWTSGRFGVVAPDRFIALAEDSGLVGRLGDQVLQRSCAQLAAWHAELGPYLAPSHVSVNVSARQLSDGDLVDKVVSALADHRLPPSALCLELTETAFVDDLDQAMSLLASLRAVGVHLALDDFGTGYSSLSYLRAFPGDFVKIDRSFVAGLRDGDASAAIVEAVIRLAAAVGLAPVGEGVETAEEAAALVRLGCSFGQGWHLGRPLPAEELVDRLRAASLEVA